MVATGVSVATGVVSGSELDAAGAVALSLPLPAGALLLAALLADALATGSFSFALFCAATTVAPITTTATSNNPAHNVNFFCL
ncbi:hypothetical protein SDC9_176667 [bioreactor metagenome]|uniref:Uncharacterized protein n=1 Tax=bioreactor metagenome TaxID=1076179 RepID=A0A645GSM7_9ZZZZ